MKSSLRLGRLLSLFWLIAWFGAASVTWSFGSSYLSEHKLELSLQTPTLVHPLGFDAFGRDLAAVVLKGSLTSAAFSLAIVVFSGGASILMGAFASFAPKPIRFTFARVTEALLAFPSLFFALAYAAIRGPGWDTLTVALLIGILPSFFRLVFVRTRELLIEDYVLAAKSMGSSHWHIFRYHLSPSLLSLCSIKIPNLFSHALLAEATLSFLGVGAPIGKDTWGSLLHQGKAYLFENPHIAFGTGVPLVLTVLALQSLSEGNYSLPSVEEPKNKI